MWSGVTFVRRAHDDAPSGCGQTRPDIRLAPLADQALRHYRRLFSGRGDHLHGLRLVQRADARAAEWHGYARQRRLSVAARRAALRRVRADLRLARTRAAASFRRIRDPRSFCLHPLRRDGGHSRLFFLGYHHYRKHVSRRTHQQEFQRGHRVSPSVPWRIHLEFVDQQRQASRATWRPGKSGRHYESGAGSCFRQHASLDGLRRRSRRYRWRHRRFLVVAFIFKQ